MNTNKLPEWSFLNPRVVVSSESGAGWVPELKRWVRKTPLFLLALPLVAAVSFVAISQSTLPPSIPAVALSADPLYAASAGDKPVLALALSVEFPTVGAQYVDPDNNNSGTTDDVTYSPTIEYLGYYDAESCYTYDDSGTGAPTGQTSNYKRFVRRGPAIALSTANADHKTWTTRMCWNGTKSYSKDDGTDPAFSTTSNDAFSGNFLNWASSSAIDMLRLSLTGGDRVIDTTSLTVLQRAVLPDGDPISMGNSSNFPSKRLYKSGTSRAITATNFASASYASGVPYFGAVPTAMASAAGTNDIYVANTLNRIYFGTSKSGNNSSGFGSYTLGGASSYQIGTKASSSTSLVTASYQVGSTSDSSASRPSGTTQCADKGGTCYLPSGTWEIWYGRNGGTSWKVTPATGEVPCSESLFGNPSGSSEKCYYRAYSGSWTPSPTATWCASEGGTCTLPSGVWEVYYGSGTSWYVAPATGAVPCTNDLWGDPISGTGKNCYYRAYTGSWTPSTATGLNSDGYFYARVQVCDRNSSTYALKDKREWGKDDKGLDKELCKQYTDGTHPIYKPVGAIQNYSDRLRLAAFGYLLDQTASYSSGRYGGVLRAPMKYVGAKTFDTNGVENTPSTGNPKQEWNPLTGVFYANPDGNTTVPTTDERATYLSGVISYVNQFGRTGAVAGRYKKYDPIGELHYETLRYLQGLAPSADAVSNISTAMYDGFPVAKDATTGWTDPYGDGRSSTSDYACLKSNIVVIGDKNTHDGNRLPTANAANNVVDINAWRTVVQNFEKNVTSTYIDGSGTSRTTSNPNGANASVPSGTSTSQMMGSAYWAHTHDIRGTGWTNATSNGAAGTTLQRPGLRVKTFVFDVNEYGASNDATARRTSNQLFMAAKYGGFETYPSNKAQNPYNTRGNPFVNEKDGTNNKYVWEDTDTRTTRTGEANSYFLQSDARGVLSAFDDIFNDAGSASYNIGDGANDANPDNQGSVDTIYQGKFDTNDWSGDVEAKSRTTGELVWSAATQLTSLRDSGGNRKIVVGTARTSLTPAPIPTATDFTWGAIETSLKTALDTAAADGLAESRLNYLRGDTSMEGSTFRKRNRKLLGDIINSGVAYSGAPTTTISSSTYATFRSTYASRTAAVFVGANDGMLHAFNAGTGAELFAYIPSWLGPKLANLTSQYYTHQSFVDSTPTVAEAEVGSAGTSADWKTVLVSGTGGGGQGVFALDVTNPSEFTKDNVMWEFTHADDQDMGNVIGKPRILKLRTNAYNASTATYKWFAVVGSGVNNYVSDSAGLFSSTGRPALFLLDLSKPAGTRWQENTNYYKIQLPVDDAVSLTTSTYAGKATGLVNFAVNLGLAGQVAQIYMGDLHGNLWKLDFSLSAGTSEWNMGKLSAFTKETPINPTPYPLFIAKDASGNLQPITTAPVLAAGDERGTFFVGFGTGKYLESADKASTATQTLYTVFDNGSSSGDTLVGTSIRASAISGRARLKQSTVTTTGVNTADYTPGRAATNLDTEVIRSGWYADLPNSGERQIHEATPISLTTLATFASTIPGASTSDGCTPATDSGKEYTIDLKTGDGTVKNSQVGLLGGTMVVERPELTTYTATDSTGKRIKTLVRDIYQLGSQGWVKTSTVTTQVAAGRLSWRQINNYLDLKS